MIGKNSIQLLSDGYVGTCLLGFRGLVDSNSRGVSVTLKSYPYGLSRAPLKIQLSDASRALDVVLLPGFFGVFQDQRDHSLSPEIAWAVVWRDPRVGLAGAEDGELLQTLEQLRLESLKTKNRTGDVMTQSLGTVTPDCA